MRIGPHAGHGLHCPWLAAGETSDSPEGTGPGPIIIEQTPKFGINRLFPWEIHLAPSRYLSG